MPTIKLGGEVVARNFMLDDGELFTIEAKQVDGHGMLRFEAYTTAKLGMADDDVTGPEMHYELRGALYRTGVQAYLSISEANLVDEEGEQLLNTKRGMDSFLKIWANPALDEIVLTVQSSEPRKYSYRDLIMQVVYEANPQWNVGLFREKAPSTPSV